jgi:hypothetical protein
MSNDHVRPAVSPKLTVAPVSTAPPPDPTRPLFSALLAAPILDVAEGHIEVHGEQGGILVQ